MNFISSHTASFQKKNRDEANIICKKTGVASPILRALKVVAKSQQHSHGLSQRWRRYYINTIVETLK